MRNFICPAGIAVNDRGDVYVADTLNHTIRKITPAGVVTTLAGQAGQHGSIDGIGRNARFWAPFGIAVDYEGNVYVADTANNTIRKFTPNGVVTTLAGLAGQPGSADGIGIGARFRNPWGVAVDNAGNVYVADSSNFTIRKITPAGAVTTLAGLAGQDGSADGIGASARFKTPFGVAVDSAWNVYVADAGNNTIRKITASGAVSTLAGLAGQDGSADGIGANARFKTPFGVAVDSAWNVYVADTGNNAIRRITLKGIVSTVAGRAGVPGGSDEGKGKDARFFCPNNVAVDSAGNIYVADTDNHTVRKGALFAARNRNAPQQQ